MAEADPLFDEIASLLSGPGDCDDAAHLERTLTDGYARVLLLEAERLRLEKEIGRLTRTVELRRQGSPAHELSALADRIETQADDLRALRALLAPLRRRHSAAVTRS